MIDAIYQGLLYGLIAGFTVFGFGLTLVALYGLVESVTFILGIHHKYFTSGDEDERGDRSG